MTFTILMLILLTIIIAVMILSREADKERQARERANYEALRDRYLDWVRHKYYGTMEPMGYRARRHVDFTGGELLPPAELENVKKEVML